MEKNSGGGDNNPLFAVWTDDYDCGHETQWWYCICDHKFDIDELKSKLRYKIKYGEKRCSVQIVDPTKYADEMYGVYIECQNSYPSENRIIISKESYNDYLENLKKENKVVYLLSFKETQLAIGYAVVTKHESHIDLTSQKVNPAFEKYQANAALIYGIFCHYNCDFSKQFYVCDGSRNINHKTNFQEYLENLFGFRKVYCRLHIRYKPILKIIIYILFPFRKLLQKFDSNRNIHLINAVLKMEEVARSGR